MILNHLILLHLNLMVHVDFRFFQMCGINQHTHIYGINHHIHYVIKQHLIINKEVTIKNV